MLTVRKRALPFNGLALLCCRAVWLTGCLCRWSEAHHQAEALGLAGGAGRQVRVAPRGGRVLRWLPAPHAGARPREESHGGRVPAPPLAYPLVAPSSHCIPPPTTPSLSLSRDCNRSLSSLGISDEYLFLFFCFIVLDFLHCSYHWGNTPVVCLLCISWFFSPLVLMTWRIQWVVFALCSCWLLPTAVFRSPI